MLSSCSANKNLSKEQFFLLATHHKCYLIDKKKDTYIFDCRLFLNVKDVNVVNQVYFSF